MTPDGDYVAVLNIEYGGFDCSEKNQVESTKVGEEHGSQVGKLDPLKLKINVLHGD